jgi:ABC-2 type transport system permease protein
MRAPLIALKTMIAYGVIRYLRSAWQYILPPLMTNALYFTIFGKIIGQHIGLVDGIPYIQFIAPGLIMMTIITSTYNSTLGSVFYSKFCRSIEEIVIAPIPTPVVLIGLVSMGVLRGLINGGLVAIVASFFVPLSVHNLFILFFTAVLSAALFALAGLTNGLFAKKWDDIAVIPTFVLTPITYLGGIFFSIHSLPTVWQDIARFNPLLYIINAFRYGFIGVSDTPILLALSVLSGCVLALFAVNSYLLQKGVGIKT